MTAPTRRAFLGRAAAFAALPVAPALDAAGGHGRVLPPILLPDLALTLQDGTASTLQALVKGRATAIQLMFPACSTTCPLGAATFIGVQALMPDQIERGVLLLSLDIGPFNDPPATLAAWLRRFHPAPGWDAAVPAPADLPALWSLFGQGASPDDPHTTRIQIVDRAGRLVWRTYELPAAEDIVAVLRRL